jgi:hypothetical protein
VPIIYEIDAATPLIRTRCIGPVTLADVFEHFRVLGADPAVPEQVNVLLDLREMTSEPQSHQIRAAAAEVIDLKGRVQWGVCAVVAASELLYGMSRVFGVFSQEAFRESRVFRELSEAEVWLASHRIRPGA